MTGKRKLYMIIAIFMAGFLIMGIASSAFENFLFDQIPYTYTSYLSIPSNSPNESPLGGFYKFYGKGHDFNFHIVLPGQENVEDPLCYTKDGLNGTGRINDISITPNTIIALLSGKFKDALFNTKFNGVFNMSCAAWTGYGNFSNDGQNFPGYFKINGPMTDWEGTFNIAQENNRIALKADYIWYPHANKTSWNVKEVQKTYYM